MLAAGGHYLRSPHPRSPGFRCLRPTRADWHARIAGRRIRQPYGGMLDPRSSPTSARSTGRAAMAGRNPPFVDMPVSVTRLLERTATSDAAVIRQASRDQGGCELAGRHVLLAAVAREMEAHAEAGSLARWRAICSSACAPDMPWSNRSCRRNCRLPRHPTRAPSRSDDAPLVLIVDDDRSTPSRPAPRPAGGFRIG